MSTLVYEESNVYPKTSCTEQMLNAMCRALGFDQDTRKGLAARMLKVL